MVAVMLFLRQTTGKTERYTHFCMPLKPVFTRDCGDGVHFMDEPTNGLDPAGIRQFRELFRMLRSEYGITIMISSHMLSQVERIADTIGIIHRGNLMEEISMKEISLKNTAYIELAAPDVKKAAYVLTDKLGLENFRVIDGENIRIYDARTDTGEVTRALTTNDVEIISIGRKSESLEDYFLKLTEGGVRSC